MLSIDLIAERRILEAQAQGEFDDLPGAGRPLDLEDDALVPEEMRAAYRLLRNAGFVPPEVEPHRELREIEQLMQAVQDDAEQMRLLARVRFLLERSARARGQRLDLADDYAGTIAKRLATLRAG